MVELYSALSSASRRGPDTQHRPALLLLLLLFHRGTPPSSHRLRHIRIIPSVVRSHFITTTTTSKLQVVPNDTPHPPAVGLKEPSQQQQQQRVRVVSPSAA